MGDANSSLLLVLMMQSRRLHVVVPSLIAHFSALCLSMPRASRLMSVCCVYMVPEWPTRIGRVRTSVNPAPLRVLAKRLCCVMHFSNCVEGCVSLQVLRALVT